jgi:LPXTG-motif cell wall-anchored protein
MMVATDPCAQLPTTGLDFSVSAAIFAAIAFLVFGFALLWLGKRRNWRYASAALLLVLGVCIAAVVAPPPSANADPPGCSVVASGVSVTQTSIITGLAPGIPAVAVAAIGTNTGNASIFVQMVVVSISSVTKATLAVAGICDATDYVVGAPQMPIDQTLDPAGSVDINGATIGFNDRARNQDACKGATVHLRYDVYGS